MPSADVIIYNARIFTSDESNPSAEAVAVKGNRILYVGTNEGTESYKDKSTRLIDGQGHTLTPGFIDTHVHLLSLPKKVCGRSAGMEQGRGVWRASRSYSTVTDFARLRG